MIKNDEVWSDIGPRIRKIRQLLNLKKEPFADAMGLSLLQLVQLEEGRHHTDINFFYWLVFMFDVNPDYVLMGRGPVFIRGASVMEDNRLDVHGINTLEDVVWFSKRSKLFLNNILAFAGRFYKENKDLLNNAVEQEWNNRRSQDTRPLAIWDSNQDKS